jgi:F0F1-type ATP synthase membrane subunit b/b'
MSGYYEQDDPLVNTGLLVTLIITFINFITLIACIVYFVSELNILEERISGFERYIQEKEEEQAEEQEEEHAEEHVEHVKKNIKEE